MVLSAEHLRNPSKLTKVKIPYSCGSGMLGLLLDSTREYAVTNLLHSNN